MNDTLPESKWEEHDAILGRLIQRIELLEKAVVALADLEEARTALKPKPSGASVAQAAINMMDESIEYVRRAQRLGQPSNPLK